MSGNTGLGVLPQPNALSPVNVRFRSLTRDEGIGGENDSSLTPSHQYTDQRDSIKALQNALRRSMTLNGVMDPTTMTSRDNKIGTLDLSESEGVSAGTSKSWMMNPVSKQYSLAGSSSAAAVLPTGTISPTASSVSTIGSLSTLKLAPMPTIPKRSESINEAAEALRRFIRFSKATTGPQENLDALDASARNLLVLKLFRLLCKKHRDLKILQASRQLLDDRATLSTPHTLNLPGSTPELPASHPLSQSVKPTPQSFLLVSNPPRRKRHSRGILSSSTGHRTDAVAPQMESEAASTSSSESVVQIAATRAISPSKETRSKKHRKHESPHVRESPLARGTQMSPFSPALIEVATSPLRHEVVPAAIQTSFSPHMRPDTAEQPLSPRLELDSLPSRTNLQRGSRHAGTFATDTDHDDDGFVQEVKQLREFLDALQNEVQNLLPIVDAGDHALQTAPDGSITFGNHSRNQDPGATVSEVIETDSKARVRAHLLGKKRTRRKRPRNVEPTHTDFVRAPLSAPYEASHMSDAQYGRFPHPLYHYTDYTSTETPPRYRDDHGTEMPHLPPRLHPRETTSRVSTASLSTPPPLIDKRQQRRELPSATQTKRPETTSFYPSTTSCALRSPQLRDGMVGQYRTPSCPVNPSFAIVTPHPHTSLRQSPVIRPRRNSAGSSGGFRPAEPDASETLPRPRRSKVKESPEQWHGPIGETSNKWRFPRLAQTHEAHEKYTTQSPVFAATAPDPYLAPAFEYTSSMADSETVISPTSLSPTVRHRNKGPSTREDTYIRSPRHTDDVYTKVTADSEMESPSPLDQAVHEPEQYEAVGQGIVRIMPVEAETDASSPGSPEMRRLLPPLKQSSSHSSSLRLENGWSGYRESYAELSPSADGKQVNTDTEWSPLNVQSGDTTPYFAAVDTFASNGLIPSPRQSAEGEGPLDRRRRGRAKKSHTIASVSSSTESLKSPLAGMIPPKSRFPPISQRKKVDAIGTVPEREMYSPPPLSPSPSRQSHNEASETDQFFSPSSAGTSLRARRAQWRQGAEEMLSPQSPEADDEECYQSASAEAYGFHQEAERIAFDDVETNEL